MAAAGILYDGSLVTGLASAPEWGGLKQALVTDTGIFAVTLDGAVRAYYFRSSDDMGINLSSGVSQIAASGTHFTALMTDGTLRAFGSGAYGETSVGSWRR